MADMYVTPDQSILKSIRKLVGGYADYEAFDIDLIIHINTYLRVLNQLGVGEKMRITGEDQTWKDFMSTQSEDLDLLDAAVSYVYARVKLIFDPPGNSFTQESLRKTAEEIEWRLREEYDTPYA